MMISYNFGSAVPPSSFQKRAFLTIVSEGMTFVEDQGRFESFNIYGTLCNRKVQTVLILSIIWHKSVLYPSVIRCSIIFSSGTIPELKFGKDSFDIITRERVAIIYSFLQYFETVVIVALLGKFV